MEAHTAFIGPPIAELNCTRQRDLPALASCRPATLRETELRALVQPNVPVKTCGGNVGFCSRKRPQGGRDFTDGLRELGLDAVALLYMVGGTIPENMSDP